MALIGGFIIGASLDLHGRRPMYRFNRSQRTVGDEGLSNAEVDPVREAGLGDGSLATGYEYEYENEYKKRLRRMPEPFRISRDERC
jgi:hypothetical protein